MTANTIEDYGNGVYTLKIERITTPAGRFESKILMGKQKRAEWIAFRTVERREEHIANRKSSVDYAANAKLQRAATRKAFDATEHFAVGDILVSSWGYDQTNVDFYEVLAVTRGMVTIVDIGQTLVPGSEGFMSEKVMPDSGYTNGNVTRHRATSTSLRIEDYAYASKWDGAPKYQSHYA